MHRPPGRLPPRAAGEDREFQAILRRVERQERAESRVRGLGAALLGLGAVGVVVAFGVALAGRALAAFTSLPLLATGLALAGGLAALAVASFALPGLLAGIGLLRARPWARAWATLIGVLLLFFVPIGTLLGLWILVVVHGEDGRRVLGRRVRRRRLARHPA